VICAGSEAPDLSDLECQVERVGAFETLPALDGDIVFVSSALDIPVVAPKCRGKLVHLCESYGFRGHDSGLADEGREKPQMDRYYSVPCARIVTSQHLKDLFAEKFHQRVFFVPGWADAPGESPTGPKELAEAIDTIFRWETAPPDYKPEASDAAKRIRQDLTSIVILTLNQLDYTRKCLDSLFAYTDVPFELIVVDNGSKDGTWAYLESVRKKRKNVRLIRNPENMGFAFGCNQGIIISEGEYMVLLNNDTVVTRNWLKRLKQTLNAVTGAGLIGPVSNYVSGAQRVEAGDLKTLDQIQGFAGSLLIQRAGQVSEVNRLVGFCLMVKREVFDRVGLLDSGFAVGNFEDDDLCVRARLAGFRCVIAHDVFVYHFGGRTFAGNHIDYRRQMEHNQQRFATKWAALVQDRGRPAPGAADRGASEGGDSYPGANDGQAGDGDEAVGLSGLESRGVAHFQAGRFKEALGFFEAILDRKPGNRDACYNAALCCLRTGDNPRARRYLHSVLDSGGVPAAEIHNLLGVSFVQEGNYTAASACFEDALSLDPDLTIAAENLKYCKQQMK
jgi:GT2 family glycosyltransferase